MNSIKNGINKLGAYKSYILKYDLYILYKDDLALNNQQELTCH